LFSALLLLGGCATQEPVKIVDAACDSASCMGQMDQVRQESTSDLEACRSGRLAAEEALKAEKVARNQAEKALAEERDALSRCQGELAALHQQASAEVAACESLRVAAQKQDKDAETRARQAQRMRDLEKGLRQRLQSEIGNRDVEIEQLRSQLTVRVLDRILFESGSAEILPQGRRVLDAVATALSGGDETIRIEGHADTVPIGPSLKSKYFSNWELSTGRSSSVARYFENNHGIAPTRMEAVGFSKYRPIAPNDTEENRQRNRRVEIVVTPWKPGQDEAAP
jgi:chemotaxis protein MotB